MNNKEKITDTFFELTDANIKQITDLYKIIDVSWLDYKVVKTKMLYENDYFNNRPKKVETINNMLEYYLNHKDAEIYKKTNYLCDESEKICICNLHANYFRKISDENNYNPEKKYISWFRKEK